jgi:hypothetical protein
MSFNPFKLFSNRLPILPVLMADADTEGSGPDPQEVHEKIAVSKNRRIPVIKFSLLFVAIVIVVLVLEYFL